MSDSNQETNYEADKCQQETTPASFAFDKHEKEDAEEHDKLLSSNEQNGAKETIEENLVLESPKDNLVIDLKVPTPDKSLRKKDSTGVRWVDWEGVAEISEKKGIRSFHEFDNMVIT